MQQQLKSSFSIAALALMSLVFMGVESCSQPSEYCKVYSSREDQLGCSEYCEKNAEFKSSTLKSQLVEACQLGQMGMLSASRPSAAELVLVCDRKYAQREVVRACRSGVTAEELRLSKNKAGPGTSSDRETGNNR